MNPKYDTQLKVRDIGECDFTLVNSQDDIREFNNEYNEDYSHYFIEWSYGIAIKLYGSDGLRMHNNVYFVGCL